MHLPVNHPLRRVWQTVGFLTGAMMVILGMIGYTRSSDSAFFSRSGEVVLGITFNPFFAVLFAAIGVLVLVFTVVGRALGVWGSISLGSILLVVGLVGLALIRTSANYLAFTMTNVNVVFIAGLLVMLGGLYAASTKSSSTASFSVASGAHS